MAKNDITGDEIKTNVSSDNYRDGWDRIFNKGYESVANNLIESVQQAVNGDISRKTYVLSEEEYNLYKWYEYLASHVDDALGPASNDVIDMIYQDFVSETGIEIPGDNE